MNIVEIQIRMDAIKDAIQFLQKERAIFDAIGAFDKRDQVQRAIEFQAAELDRFEKMEDRELEELYEAMEG